MALEPNGINPDTFDKIPPDVQRFFTAGNRVQPLFGADSIDTPQDDIWVRTRDVVHEARATIQIEMFNIDDPDIVDLLIEEAKRGVKVQIIMDPPLDDRAAERKAAIERLQEHGVELHLYPVPVPPEGPRPPASDPPPSAGQEIPAPHPPLACASMPDETALPDGRRPLDHVKMLIVDGRRVIIGGMNWGSHSRANHDFDVEIEGPAVSRLGWLFREDWLRCGGTLNTLPPVPRTQPAGDAWVNLIVSADDPHEHTIARSVLRAIRNARRSIHAELFALTDYRVVQALIDSHARGVDVKIILDPLKIGDHATNEKARGDLRRAGVDVKWYVCNPATLEKMHAKVGLFDDDQAIVGSANWTSSGFNTNREADVEILSRDVNQTFERQFEADWNTRTADTPTYIEED